MSNYDISPSPSMTLTTNEQIRAYVNPTRMTILALLAQEKQSVSGVARQLNVHPANLTHHFKLMEKLELIKLVEKRETGKNLEKFYRAVAYNFTINPGDESANKKTLALAILRDNLTAALHTLNNPSDERDVLGVLKTVRLSPKDIVKFEQKLLELANEFGESSTITGIAYSLNASLYPTEAGNLPEQEIKIQVEK
jgi:DNA-binding transcriptional ArsR family regulator